MEITEMSKEEILQTMNKSGCFEAGRQIGYRYGFVQGGKAQLRRDNEFIDFACCPDELDELLDQAKKFYKLKKALKEWIIDQEIWREEYGEGLFETLKEFCIGSLVKYNPDIHSDVEDVDSGDKIWWFGD